MHKVITDSSLRLYYDCLTWHIKAFQEWGLLLLAWKTYKHSLSDNLAEPRTNYPYYTPTFNNAKDAIIAF